jgi:hypothetical protein
MTVIVAVGVLLTQSTFNLPIFVLTILGTALLYVGQHKLLPSTSPAFQLVLQDFLVAIFLGVGSALINAGSTYIIGGVICWGCLWKLTLSVALGYLTKTIPASAITRPIKTAVILLVLIFACNISQAQTGPWKYFWKSKSAIEMPKALKSYGDVATTATSSFIFKFDASVSGVSYQYQGKEKGWATNYLDKVGLGISYQKISNVNGQNYSNLTLKALLELPTPMALTQKVGVCAGIFIWDNKLGMNIGYTIGQKYPYFGPALSYNF